MLGALHLFFIRKLLFAILVLVLLVSTILFAFFLALCGLIFIVCVLLRSARVHLIVRNELAGQLAQGELDLDLDLEPVVVVQGSAPCSVQD